MATTSMGLCIILPNDPLNHNSHSIFPQIIMQGGGGGYIGVSNSIIIFVGRKKYMWHTFSADIMLFTISRESEEGGLTTSISLKPHHLRGGAHILESNLGNLT